MARKWRFYIFTAAFGGTALVAVFLSMDMILRVFTLRHCVFQCSMV